jgi:hypothetical protein
MLKKRKPPYVWVTWLSKVMAGEQACVWASWFKAHYQGFDKVESDFDLARWNLEHTRLLLRTRAQLAKPGAAISIEGENAFRHDYKNGIVLAGKPDLVVIEGKDALIIDCKTGKPRVSDRIQVQIYMHLLPKCFPELTRCTVRGRVVYGHRAIDINPSSVDDSFVEHLDFFVNLVASKKPPFKAPSHGECRFCEITKADCVERVG